jgi:hypothetical protein
LRIDIKKVRGRKYVQLVDGKKVFHIGATRDFDSWIVAYLVWEKQWQAEYLIRRQKMFEKVETDINECGALSDEELNVLDQIRKSSQPSLRVLPPKFPKVPRSSIYGKMIDIENPDSFFGKAWKYSDRGKSMRKRIRNIKI